jgi:hypothetical protein
MEKTMYDITQRGIDEIVAWVDANHIWPNSGEFWVLDARAMLASGRPPILQIPGDRTHTGYPKNMIVSPDEIFKV